jgi:MerR family transcriptional regulator, light-induced transcriptional regulator
MLAYSISDLENLTGIKAHTLRIWEKRYGIIQPKRTDTNIRYFTEDDVRKILHITLLNKKGFKISKIAKMSEPEIRKQVATYSDVSPDFEDQLDGLMISMFELDASKFNIILDTQIQNMGFENTIESIIYPMLDKLSMMWMAGSVKIVHETFVTHTISRKIIQQIEYAQPRNYNDNFKFVLFLPENENNELTMLFAEYILTRAQIPVVNLGSQVKLIDVLEAAHIFNATHIFTIFNDSFSETPLQPYINELARNLTQSQLLVTGYSPVKQNVILPQNARLLHGLDDLKEIIQMVHK